jgi:hypothetical protein
MNALCLIARMFTPLKAVKEKWGQLTKREHKLKRTAEKAASCKIGALLKLW